ncbi:MAG: S8 family serine peptidase [Pyrinomonadaceae bacterium]
MRRRSVLSYLVLTAMLAACFLPGPVTGQKRGLTDKRENKEPFVPGEVLVKFTDGADSLAARSAKLSMGAEAVESLGGEMGWMRVKLPAGKTTDAAIKDYQALDGVEYVQPNYYYHLLLTPNDPQYLSGINGGMYGLGKISAPAAWDLSTGSSSVVVADIDTGMRYTHQDLAANAWINTGEIAGNGVDDDANGFVDDVNGWDFRFNDSDPIDLDSGVSSAHGTHTAGTIGAVGDNLVGVVGVNWNVKLMTVKIFNNTVVDDTTSAMLVNAYAYIRMMKLRGIDIRATNNSYGGCTEACGFDQATKDGIDAMGDAGIVSVFAAGNNSGSNNDSVPFYPTSYTSPSIIAVASSDSSDNRSGFSNVGPTSVDLAAPGSGILSTVPTGYSTFSGTSMATPHVTGAVALLSAYRPDLSAASLKASILNNVDVLANWNGVVKTGGRLNVFKAMQFPTVCTFNTGGNLMRVRPRGGNFRIGMTVAQNCDYSVKSNANWITLTSSNVGSGNGTVTITVSPNAGAARTGTISIAGQAYTIRQGRI